MRAFSFLPMTYFKEWFDSLSDSTKHVMDSVSVGTALAGLFELLPHIATLLSIFWFLIRIYETRTVQSLLGRKPRTRRSDD